MYIFEWIAKENDIHFFIHHSHVGQLRRGSALQPNPFIPLPPAIRPYHDDHISVRGNDPPQPRPPWPSSESSSPKVIPFRHKATEGINFRGIEPRDQTATLGAPRAATWPSHSESHEVQSLAPTPTNSSKALGDPGDNLVV